MILLILSVFLVNPLHGRQIKQISLLEKLFDFCSSQPPPDLRDLLQKKEFYDPEENIRWWYIHLCTHSKHVDPASPALPRFAEDLHNCSTWLTVNQIHEDHQCFRVNISSTSPQHNSKIGNQLRNIQRKELFHLGDKMSIQVSHSPVSFVPSVKVDPEESMSLLTALVVAFGSVGLFLMLLTCSVTMMWLVTNNPEQDNEEDLMIVQEDSFLPPKPFLIQCASNPSSSRLHNTELA